MEREALKLALEAMEYMAQIRDCGREAGYPLSDADKRMQIAITAVKAALAQPEQEQRPWVGLTEKDFSAINQSCLTKLQAATSAESILKKKNA
jgi:hypothetical protein